MKDNFAPYLTMLESGCNSSAEKGDSSRKTPTFERHWGWVGLHRTAIPLTGSKPKIER